MKYVKKELIIIMISVMGMSFSSLLIAMTHSQLANKIKKIDALMKDTRKKMKDALVSASKGEDLDDLEEEIGKNEEQIEIFLHQFQAAGLKGYASKYDMQWKSMLFGEVEKTLEPLLKDRDKEGINRVMSFVNSDVSKVPRVNPFMGTSSSLTPTSGAETGHRGGQTIEECGGEKMIGAFTDHLDFLFGKKRYDGYEDYLLKQSNWKGFLGLVNRSLEDIGKIISQIYYKDSPLTSKKDVLLKGDWIKVLQGKELEGKEEVLNLLPFGFQESELLYELKRYREHDGPKKQSDIYPDEPSEEHQIELESFSSEPTEEEEAPTPSDLE
ncbi:MAG: hypothetical protein WBQ73_02710 [Candidatus Babeliales bacterium]